MKPGAKILPRPHFGQYQIRISRVINDHKHRLLHKHQLFMAIARAWLMPQKVGAYDR